MIELKLVETIYCSIFQGLDIKIYSIVPKLICEIIKFVMFMTGI